MGSVITIAGEKLFAAKAQANQQLDIDTFIFANVPGQDPTAPIDREEPLPPQAQIVHQQVVQQVGRINENVVVYSTVLDSVTGPFEFNWVGLYSSVNQTLVAINHVPTVAKTVTGPGVAGNTLNRNFGIEYSGIADLTGITVAPETWQLDFTARLSGMDELTRQLAADMNGKDWFIGEGFKVVPSATANSFLVTPGVGYVSGLRIELEQEHIINVQTYPQFVYVDAWFDGTASSKWKPNLQFTVTTSEMDDYVDVTGVKHYVFKLIVLNSASDNRDLRSDSSLASREWSNENHVINRSDVHEMINDSRLRTGMTVKTRQRFREKRFGAGEYLIYDKNIYREEINNPLWEPDGFADHLLNNGLVAVLQYSDKMYASTFGVYPNTNDDMYEPVQAFFDRVQAGDAVIEEGCYQFSRPPKLAKKNPNNENDLKRLTLKMTGVVFKQHSTFDSELYAHLLSVEESKRYKIDGLRVEGLVKISGMWDSQYKNCWFDYTEFGDETLHIGFVSHYWSYFERCRLGPTTLITSGKRVVNHEFNANVFVASIIGSKDEYSFRIKGTGSIQGAQVIGGEIRGEVIVEDNQPSLGTTPNTMVWYGCYYDSSNSPTDLKGLKISILGQSPQVNSFTLSGLGIADNDSALEIDMFGYKPEKRVPISSENLISGGDMTGIVPFAPVPFEKYNCTAYFDGENVNIESNGEYSYLILPAVCPHDGWYSATVIYEKPVNNSLSVRFENITAGMNVYDCFNNKTALRGRFVAGSYTFNASAGDVVCIKFYGDSSLSVKSIKFRSACINYGAKSLLTGKSKSYGKPKEYYMQSQPVSGKFKRGEKIHCIEPEPGGDIGWVCTISGMAGSTAVFKTIGKIGQ